MSTINQAIEAAPCGMGGLVIEPWSKGDVYGVAANWADASCPIWSYGEDGWHHSGWQVADFSHEPREALVAELQESLVASGDDPDEVDKVSYDSIEF